MFAITGITGQVGGAVARALLEQGRSIRAVVRDPARGEEWARRGAEVAIADLHDAASLRTAFEGVEGAFAIIPPYFAPRPGYAEAREVVDAPGRALAEAAPARVACLSSVGAHREEGLGLITQLQIMERAFSRLPMPIAFLRAGWFMENARWDVESARGTGEIRSFLAPTDRAIPMVATEDLGRIGAETLLEGWAGRRILEIEGPRRYSPDDLASSFSAALGRPVRAIAVPRERWAGLFEAQGMAPGATAPRIEMLDGFNSGWIDFVRGEIAEHVRGRVTLDRAIERLVASE